MLQLGCFWPGGQPAADVTMNFNNVMETKPDLVTRNVQLPDDVVGSNLTCSGDQLGRRSECRLMFEPPRSPGHDNSAVTPVTERETLVLRVNLMSGVKSQGNLFSLQVLPAEFTWYSLTSGQAPIQNGDKFTVTSTYYTSSLQITKMSEAESGKYECRAKNFVGSQGFIFTLSVTKEASGSHQGLNGGEIAGIVIGGIAGVVIIVSIVLFMSKRKTGNTPGALYEDADVSPANTYETKLPGAVIDTMPRMNEESNYQQLIHHNKSIYHTVMPGSGK
ncbi:uncharacterized protein LOC142661570 [Rhinoderma darwinii]|uniref:uncharacterized protein LOC142661570 n=1 Tax=Rhinoderma darwinii TaxID=43563 RepID=UPI003F666BCA